MIKKKQKVNVLIIGTGMYVCGRGTDGYGTILPAIYESQKRKLIGDVLIAGTNSEGIKIVKEKVSQLNSLFGFEIQPRYFPEKFNNVESYIDAIREFSKPACAIVVVPDNLHRKIAGETIKNGYHTLVVKPLAPTLKEVYELIQLQEKNNVYCAVEFHKRYDRSNLMLKDTIESGKIGNPLYFIVEYSQKKSIPTERFKKWVEQINIFQYLGIHYVDIIFFATRAVPKRVMAIGQKNYLISKGIATYDSIEAFIEWEMPSGVRFNSAFFTNWIDPESTSAMSDQRIKVIGTKGRYESDQKYRGIRIVTDEFAIQEPNPDFCAMYGTDKGNVSFMGYGIESVIQFICDVCDIESGILTVSTLEDKRPTFKESIIPTAIIEAVNKSLRENSKWINIEYKGDSNIEIM